MINSANRTKSIKLSQIRKMFEVTNPNAINLGIGEPDFDVPKNIKDAIKKSIDDNDTHYTPNKGYIELREAICDKFKKDNQIDRKRRVWDKHWQNTGKALTNHEWRRLRMLQFAMYFFGAAVELAKQFKRC